MALLSWLGTRAYVRYAISRGILDHPNERSSHRTPTPRGGGIAIVVSSMVGVIALAVSGLMTVDVAVALVGGGALIAAMGYADDHHPLAAHWRLGGHFAAAVWLVAWLGGSFPYTDPHLHLGVAGDLLAVLFVVWMVNLTNFMDGIDGIATVEAIVVALGGAGLAAATSGGPDGTALVLAAACFGFLYWNWPPARVFMGDVGSGYLGYALAALSLSAGKGSLTLFWGWVILLGAFVADATLTLARRIGRGERFYQAHRTHAYQHAAVRSGSHRRVTLAVAAIDVVWLLPIAILVATGKVPPASGAIVAYVPLAIIVLGLGGGRAHAAG